MVDIERLKARLRANDALRDDDQIVEDVVDRIEPAYAGAWPTRLSMEVRDALVGAGILRLYQHQADAIDRSLSGADVVLESPTASGKTAAFAAPMLETLVRNPGSHALMIYPMKALAFDQREQIRSLCAPLSIESWTYDGDTDEEHKKAIRTSPPRVLLTNPEYLNMSFLAYRAQWEGFLKNLQYIVIDEMHEYRGFFGGNMALLLRRFFLQLNRLGVSPRIFLSTATCANPEEHAESLTGRAVEAVSARNTLLPRRHFVFVKPEIPDYQYRDILRLRIEQASLAALEEGLQVLVFCPTKKFLEEAFRRCRNEAATRGLDSRRIVAFHADMNSKDRVDIQRRVKSGEVDVILTTNALELGIDIGTLDGVVLAGFPPSIMSAWQQIGRAGRGWNQDAFVLFYAMNDPIDAFFVNNLHGFLNKPFDQLVIDPANTELIEKHLGPLMQETDGILLPGDGSVLGDVFHRVALEEGGKPIQGDRPQIRLNIRGVSGTSYALKSGNEEIGQISELRRFREAYIGAVFPFFGRRYRVHAHEASAVVLADVDQHLKTEPGFFTYPPGAKIFDGKGYGEINTFYGSIDVTTNFVGYKLIDERTGDTRENKESTAYSFKNLHAFWITLPESEEAKEGIGGFEHLMRLGALFVIPADRFDVSTLSTARENADAAAYYYENYPSGIGVAKKLLEVFPEALQKGVEIAKNCGCKDGCQNCIEPAKRYDMSATKIDKAAGIRLAEIVLSAVANDQDFEYRNGRMVPLRTQSD